MDPHIEENTNRHVADVINYIKVSQYGKKRLDDLPISSRMLKEIHEVVGEQRGLLLKNYLYELKRFYRYLDKITDDQEKLILTL